MSYLNEYKNCRIIIRDVINGDTLADTKIRDYNGKTNIITVDDSSFSWESNNRVTVLIFTGTGLFEYMGTVRKSNISKTVEIALYKGKKKESRQYRRYNINSKGIVNNLIINDKLVAIHKPIEVDLVNISATGVLIRALPNYFYLNSVFQLQLPMGDTVTMMECSVVRIKECGNKVSEYGCKFLTVYKE